MSRKTYTAPFLKARRRGRPLKEEARKAKILILDIETAPILARVWRLWKENVGLNQIYGDWFILAFAAKWLGSNEVMYFDQSKEKNVEDDHKLLAKLWELLDEADIVVAHNGKKFDVKKINARLVIAGYGPPSPYHIVDTLLIAKDKFAFTSNKLQYLSDTLNQVYKKQEHGDFPGFELWRAVLSGNTPEARLAWKEMKTYNEYDVLSLEELYLKLRPWTDKHPNVNQYDADDEQMRCPICGSLHIHKRGTYTTNAGLYQRYRCEECSAWSATRYTENSKAKRKSLLKSTR